MFKDFKQFILRGNVVDLAIGVVIGASFSGLVTALVKDVITPLIGLIGGKPDFSSLSFTVNENKFLLGDFLNALISFLIVATVVYFFVVLPLNKLTAAVQKDKPGNSDFRTCTECLSLIPSKARRCSSCGSVVASKKKK